jgi:hypothetical protein
VKLTTNLYLVPSLIMRGPIPAASRTAMAPTQPPLQGVPESLSLGVKRPGREADHSLPSSAEIKNAWSYTSTFPVRLHGVVLSKAQGLYFTLPCFPVVPEPVYQTGCGFAPRRSSIPLIFAVGIFRCMSWVGKRNSVYMRVVTFMNNKTLYHTDLEAAGF